MVNEFYPKKFPFYVSTVRPRVHPSSIPKIFRSYIFSPKFSLSTCTSKADVEIWTFYNTSNKFNLPFFKTNRTFFSYPSVKSPSTWPKYNQIFNKMFSFTKL